MNDLTKLIPSGITIVTVVVFIIAVRFILNRRFAKYTGYRFRLQIITLFLSLVGLIAIIISLPLRESTIGQLLSLLGLLLSAAIALSATTLLGNILAGLMLRAIRNFRPGDFIRVGDHFGRVSERGLFHIEIQTEDRDLTTLPNLYLVTNPVKVIRSSGTFVTAEVSLGYDIPRNRVEAALIAAAENSELEDPFVHIMNLGDFSITYRVAGLLTDVKSLISARSRLRGNVLDCLHRGGIEIVSPNFMNQRVLSPDKSFIPEMSTVDVPADDQEDSLEKVLFDKADEAESLEKLRFRREELERELAGLKSRLGEDLDQDAKSEAKLEIENLKTRLERLSDYISKRKENEN